MRKEGKDVARARLRIGLRAASDAIVRALANGDRWKECALPDALYQQVVEANQGLVDVLSVINEVIHTDAEKQENGEA